MDLPPFPMRSNSPDWYWPPRRRSQNVRYSALSRLRLRHEHAVMLALDFGQRITDSFAEILVGDDDRAVEVELDHSLRLVDCLDLAFVVGATHLRGRDLGCKLHHLVGLAVAGDQRVVGRLDPDRPAALGEALVFRHLELAPVEVLPELAIGGAVLLGRVHEHAVMFAADFVETVAENVEEVLVGGDDRAVQIEFDDGLRPAQRIELGM